MPDILCISDCCCDMVFSGLARIPAPGQEEYGTDLCLRAGGGANTAMGLSRLGCSTGYVTAVGDDDFGRVVLQELLGCGVLPQWIQRQANARTWVSAALSTKEDRAFVSYAGTPVALTEESLHTLLQQVRCVHTYSYYCEQFPFLASMCRQANVPLSMDATFDGAKTLEQVRTLLQDAELFTPNETEACALLQTDSPTDALHQLANICENVVITMGAKGSIAILDGEELCAAPPPIAMVDATGAGDLFNAGLLAARLSGAAPEDQLRFATAAGTLAVSYAGGVGQEFCRERVQELASKVVIRRE